MVYALVLFFGMFACFGRNFMEPLREITMVLHTLFTDKTAFDSGERRLEMKIKLSRKFRGKHFTHALSRNFAFNDITRETQK